MRILVETSGGGGIVLVVVAALLASAHGGGIGAALAAVLITLAVVIALALAAVAAILVHRARHSPAVTWQAGPVPPQRHSAVQQGTRPALEPAAVRELHLHGIDAEQVAEILRRCQRPE